MKFQGNLSQTGLPLPVTTPAIQSFTDSNGIIWVASSNVSGGAWRQATDVLYGRVYRTAAYSFPTTTTTIPFDTVYRDQYGLYNFATHQFTCPIVGVYFFHLQVVAHCTAANQQVALQIGADLRTAVFSNGVFATYCWATDMFYASIPGYGVNAAGWTSSGVTAMEGTALNNYDQQFTMKYVGTG